jgi:hypothetical protein
MVERNRDVNDKSSSTSRDDPNAGETYRPERWRDDDEMAGADAHRSGLTREPVSVVDDRGRARDSERRNFSSDREADELGGEITREPEARDR